eukprot:GHVO01066174.1.p1 GENE.GHVO01066174.1~~GHVO01066174.1.p1  ORF type:complete len:483 (+),score=84.39 GHVO01066174.1:140-1588(+)
MSRVGGYLTIVVIYNRDVELYTSLSLPTPPSSPRVWNLAYTARPFNLCMWDGKGLYMSGNLRTEYTAISECGTAIPTVSKMKGVDCMMQTIIPCGCVVYDGLYAIAQPSHGIQCIEKCKDALVLSRVFNGHRERIVSLRTDNAIRMASLDAGGEIIVWNTRGPRWRLFSIDTKLLTRSHIEFECAKTTPDIETPVSVVKAVVKKGKRSNKVNNSKGAARAHLSDFDESVDDSDYSVHDDLSYERVSDAEYYDPELMVFPGYDPRDYAMDCNVEIAYEDAIFETFPEHEREGMSTDESDGLADGIGLTTEESGMTTDESDGFPGRELIQYTTTDEYESVMENTEHDSSEPTDRDDLDCIPRIPPSVVVEDAPRPNLLSNDEFPPLPVTEDDGDQKRATDTPMSDKGAPMSDNLIAVRMSTTMKEQQALLDMYSKKLRTSMRIVNDKKMIGHLPHGSYVHKIDVRIEPASLLLCIDGVFVVWEF